MKWVFINRVNRVLKTGNEEDDSFSMNMDTEKSVTDFHITSPRGKKDKLVHLDGSEFEKEFWDEPFIVRSDSDRLTSSNRVAPLKIKLDDSLSDMTPSLSQSTSNLSRRSRVPPLEFWKGIYVHLDNSSHVTKERVRRIVDQDEERIEEKINEILEPELNAKLDIVVLPWASASQQLQLMLSGDEKIDLLYTNATTAVQYMHSGQIMDMSELIDKYGTNLKDIYGEDIAKTNQIDGFVYGVPNQIERGSIPAIFMRKDLVEKYNINTDEIKEPKDMEKVFETVQAGEPDMTMLFSSNNSDTPLSRLSRADGLGDANTGALMDQTNSTIVENYFASDWYKETATMLHDWYQKGYISKDAGTNTENWRTVCKAGNLFSLFFAYHPGTPVEFQSSTGYEFEIVPFYDQPIINSSSYGGIIFSVAQKKQCRFSIISMAARRS
mgnify:CR=1 FL=1